MSVFICSQTGSDAAVRGMWIMEVGALSLAGLLLEVMWWCETAQGCNNVQHLRQHLHTGSAALPCSQPGL